MVSNLLCLGLTIPRVVTDSLAVVTLDHIILFWLHKRLLILVFMVVVVVVVVLWVGVTVVGMVIVVVVIVVVVVVVFVVAAFGVRTLRIGSLSLVVV